MERKAKGKRKGWVREEERKERGKKGKGEEGKKRTRDISRTHKFMYKISYRKTTFY